MMGYAERLAPLDPVERRDFTMRVVAALPALEKLGFDPNRFVAGCCPVEDGLRFWQIYVDRVAAELNRRGTGPLPAGSLLPLLLQTPPPRGGERRLLRHAHRILEAGEDRWRFVVRFFDTCEDLSAIRLLCQAPELVEDPRALASMLSGGEARAMSIALFALHCQPGAIAVANDTMDRLNALEPRARGRAITRLYGLLDELPRLGVAARLLSEALLAFGESELGSEGAGAVGFLVGAVSREPQDVLELGLVEVRLPAELCRRRLLRGDPPIGLARGLAAIFFGSFQPALLPRLLADEAWREAMGVIFCALLRDSAVEICAELRAFAGSLIDHGSAGGAHRALTAGYLGVLIDTLRRACRGVDALPWGEAAAICGYRVLLGVYLAAPGLARGSHLAGPLPRLLHGTYPDLLAAPVGAHDEVQLARAAGLLAEIELPHAPRSPAPPPEPDAVAPVEVPTVDPPFDASASDDPTPEIPVRWRRRPRSGLRCLAGALTGLSPLLEGPGGIFWGLEGRGGALRLMGVGPLRCLELRDEPQASLVGRYRLDELRSIELRGVRPGWPLVLGLAIVAAGALIGGHLALSALAAGAFVTALAGAAIVAFGCLLDRWLARAFARSTPLRRRLVLDDPAEPTRLTIELDLDAAPLLEPLVDHPAVTLGAG